MNSPHLDRIDAVRRFNRFYTRRIGLLREKLYDSPYSLAEMRVLYELAHRDGATATEVGKELDLDRGYLSRLVKRFERQGLLKRTASEKDGRQVLLSLTPAGREAFAPWEEASRRQVATMLRGLDRAREDELLSAMGEVERLLAENPSRRPAYVLRPHRPGDMGWVVERHGTLYWQEYRFDETFEALVAEIAAAFIRNFDPRRECCWIAEMDGHNAGSVFLVRGDDDETAKLRLLLVEPRARGLGLGRRLVEETVRFARQVGYRRIGLWTQSILFPARHIYEATGFKLVRSEPHRSFGQDLIAETWELDLVSPAVVPRLDRGTQ